MFGWVKKQAARRQERDRSFGLESAEATAEGDRLHRVRRAVATITDEPLYGKDSTEYAAGAAAILTKAIVLEAADTMNEDDIFVSGIFALVCTDYISMSLAGEFEVAASLAVVMTIGPDEFHRCFPAIRDSFNLLVHSQPGVLEAVGKGCETWFKNPSRRNLQGLVGLFGVLRNHVARA